MVLEAFERILNNPEKMAFYNQDPILKATFMACYEYLKEGYTFDQLGWFHTPRVRLEAVKKVA